MIANGAKYATQAFLPKDQNHSGQGFAGAVTQHHGRHVKATDYGESGESARLRFRHPFEIHLGMECKRLGF